MRGRRRSGGLGLALVGLIASGFGCGGAPLAAPPPSEALAQYADALARGDADTAYALLDAPSRQRLTRERFAALLRDNAGEMREQAALLRAQAAREVAARARVRLADGERVELALERGAWRVGGGVLDAPALATPQDAVAALRRALLRRDLAAFLRLLSRETRAALEADISRIVGATEDELDLEVDVQGDHATVRTTGGGRIELVRDGPEWRVRDIE